MTATSTPSLYSLVAALAEVARRPHAARALARHLGADDLLLLVHDPELGVLLPAPGFPQTMRGGPSWRDFLALCSEPGTHRGVMQQRNDEPPTPAIGHTGADGVTLVLLGGAPDPAEVDVLLPALPLLAALLRAETATRGDRERALREAARLNLQLQDADRRKDEFLAMLGHELRNPMAAITSALELMRVSPESLELLGRARAVIERQSQQLGHLIDDLLDVARVTRGKIVLRSAPIDLNEVVRRAVETTHALVMSRKHRLDARYIAPLIVMGDPTRLEQIVTNLLSNAAKYTDEGGRITLSIARDDDEAVLRIQDSGIGIPAEQLGNIFDPFMQVAPAIDRSQGGMGIGLTIVKELAALHGGRIDATSVVDEGSIFTVRLPAMPEDTTTPTAPTAAMNPPAERRVLVVDASDTQRQLLAAHLRAWGMAPVLCGAAADALNYLRDGGSIDVALVDGLLPADGDTRVLQELARRGAPAVLLTPLARRYHADAQRQPGAIVTKPVKASQLYEALLQLLAGRHPSEAHDAAPPRSEFDPTMATRLPLRILAVEDNATNQKLILLMLERLGYRADSAYHGLEALDAVARKTYDVLLMDVQMPEMDGLETTRRIRASLPVQPRIIAMTANAMESDRQACLAAGMDDYVSKPIQVRELRAALEHCERVIGGSPAGPVAAATPEPAPSDAELEADALGGLAQLRDLLGMEVALEIAALFLREAESTIVALRDAVVGGHADRLREAAHSLKGSAGGMHLMHLHHLASALEHRGRAGTVLGAEPLLIELERQFQRVYQVFERQLREGVA